MTQHNRKKIHRPFECLKDIVPVETLPEALHQPENRSQAPAAPPDPGEENRLFQEAMSGVERLNDPNRTADIKTKPVVKTEPVNEDLEVLMKLKGLIQSGKGIIIADTSEYIEGSGYLAPPDITTRLHRGDFSIQDHIDLHGLSVAEAEVVFEEFLNDSIVSGKRAVLVIHGRGLSSPGQPVLKTKVYQWLTRSRWRKWVIAFTSARSCDGGAGASYVLLRKRPLTKSQRKASSKL